MGYYARYSPRRARPAESRPFGAFVISGHTTCPPHRASPAAGIRYHVLASSGGSASRMSAVTRDDGFMPSQQGWRLSKVAQAIQTNAVSVPVWLLALIASASITVGSWTISTLVAIQTQQAVMLSALTELRESKSDIAVRMRALELQQARQQ